VQRRRGRVGGRGQRQRQAAVAGKGHLQRGHDGAAVAAVVQRQQRALG
jgi:hypothetical protein